MKKEKGNNGNKNRKDIQNRRIAIVTPSFFPVRGGTEQVVYEVGRRMAEKNKVVIITPKVPGAPYREQFEQMSIYRFPTMRMPVLNALSAQLVLLFFLPYILKKEKIELIHMYHVYQLGGAVAIIKKLLHLPLFTYLIGWDTYDPIRPIPRLLRPYIAWVLNSSEKVCTSCRSMRENAYQQGYKREKEMPLIPHGTNMPEMIMKRMKKVDVRSRHNTGNEKIVFSLQRLFPRKGLEYLIRAIPIVIKKYPQVKFIIGGKGPEREKLEEEARELSVSEKVVFAGFIPDDELKAYYAAANVFALPSLYEGFGVVYVDALTNGVPVVTTRCGGPEDIVTEENGFLVPIRDEKAFAEALIAALLKTWDHQRIKKDAERYDWKNVIEEYKSIYRELLN